MNIASGDRYCGGCGAPAPQAADAQLLLDLQQVTVGDYEILGILGRGGMGLVYLAHDITLSKKVAIKVLPPSFLQGEAAVERFRREARIAASLRHRHITSVFALKETTKLLFFVMEYVEGRTLDAILQDEQRLPVDTAAAVLYDAMNALTYAHRREVIHRDLKPGNIIIDVEGLAMITDFGVAKVSTAQGLTTTGSTVGSPKYMSPEQWSGKATHQTDQYALGCVAYQLLAGRAPFEGDTLEELMKQQLFDTPVPLLEVRPDCPPAMAEAIARMLEKDPTKRWPTLDAARSAMGLHAPGLDDPARDTLAQWAKRGHDLRALPKTPRSPIPVSKITRPPSVAPLPTPATAPEPTPAPEPRPRGRIPGWLIGLGGGVAAGVAVWLIFGGNGGGPSGKIAAFVIEGAPPAMAVGDRVTLVPRASDAAGNTVSAGEVTWTTSDSGVAIVSRDGGLQARAPGSVVLRAAAGGREASVTVTIRPAAVASVQVTPREVRVALGERVQLTASV
ncbi:MAG TPA: protein kinase, partial [Gemmatimonadales bacterium]